MSLRSNLSDAVREAKTLSGMTYDEIAEKTGYSKSAIRYALNGGEKVGLDAMNSMIICMGFSLEVHLCEVLS